MVMGGRSPHRVTSKDVAREAGVSRTTVSYVLNKTPNQSIPERTRTRVLKAAERLNYTPLASARILRRGRSDIVLLLLPDWPAGATISALTEHLAQCLLPHGLTLITHTHLRDRPLDDVWRALSPAAVIRAGRLGPEEDARLRRAQIGLLIEFGDAEASAPTLGLPLRRMGQLQARHLAARGHQRLGYAAPDETRVRMFRDTRLRGVRAACAALGLEPPDVRTVALHLDSAADAIAHWHAGGVTGVCAYNDETAIALLTAAKKRGLLVPDDLAVIGADDIPLARLFDPPLTTVAVDTRRIGQIVAGHVVHGLTGVGRRTRLPNSLVDLVVREST